MDFLPKDHRIQGNHYASLLVARSVCLEIIKFCTPWSDMLISEVTRNLSPFPNPITICHDITSYNVVGARGAARFKYIKVPGIIDHFPHLTNALGPYTSPSAISDLVLDADPVSHIVRGSKSTPLPTEGQAVTGTKPASLGYVVAPDQRQAWIGFSATATAGTIMLLQHGLPHLQAPVAWTPLQPYIIPHTSHTSIRTLTPRFRQPAVSGLKVVLPPGSLTLAPTHQPNSWLRRRHSHLQPFILRRTGTSLLHRPDLWRYTNPPDRYATGQTTGGHSPIDSKLPWRLPVPGSWGTSHHPSRGFLPS